MSNTLLKIIAIVSMLFDHIWIFFPESPYFFHCMGRISAPIFLFCCIQGYIHTSSKKKLFIRIYLLNVIVEVVNLIFGITYLRMNFVRTLLFVLIIIFIIDKFKSKNENSKLYLRIFLAWQLITTIIIFYILSSDTMISIIGYNIVFLIISITANISYLDGGILFVILGVCMYIFLNNKTKFLFSFIILTLLYILLFNTELIRKLDMLSINMPLINAILNSFLDMILGVNPMSIKLDMIWEDPQWMMILSLPLILKYNNKKGSGLKWLFYVFYPVHIAVLFKISTL